MLMLHLDLCYADKSQEENIQLEYLCLYLPLSLLFQHNFVAQVTADNCFTAHLCQWLRSHRFLVPLLPSLPRCSAPSQHRR